MGAKKETMRKISCIFVALLTLVCALAFVACNDAEQAKPVVASKYVEGMDEFAYYADDNTVSLLWPKDKTIKSVTIPACVSEINDNAFDGCASLEEVIFEKDSKLKKVNTFAFKDCASLKSISLPSGVESLGDRVFYGCTSLEEVDFSGDDIKSCGSLLFEKCTSLKRAVVPAGMTSVSAKEFRDCALLEKITFGNGVATIEDNAFCNKNLVGEMTFPSSIKKIGEKAFYGNKFSAIGFSGNVESIGKEAFYGGENAQLESLTLPFVGQTANGGTLSDIFSQSSLSSLESLTVLGGTLNSDSLKWFSGLKLDVSDDVNIEAGALDDTEWYKNQEDGVVYVGNIVYGYKGVISNMTRLSIRDGATKIIDDAFGIQVFVWDFVIPSSMREIGKRALIAPNLIRIYVPDDSKYYASVGNCLLAKDGNGDIGKTVLMGCSGSEIPSYVEVIGEYAFALTAADGITIPKNVQRIEKYAFMHSLGAPVVFESGSKLETIEDYAFCTYGYYAENNVLDLSALANLKSIGNYAFSLGDSTVGYYVDDALEGLAKQLFLIGLNIGHDYIDRITSVILPKSLTSIGKYAFSPNLASVQVPTADSKTTYQAVDNCLIKGSTVVLGTSNSVIPTKVGKIAITSIGECAFAYKNISNVVIPDTIETIGSRALEGCYGITTLKLPRMLKSIGTSAFENADIESITLSASLEGIGESAFVGTKLTSVTIPSSVVAIGEKAFFGVPLTSVTFDDKSKLESIGNSAFENTNIESITIPTSLKNIGERAFVGTKLTNVTIPTSVVTIGERAFAGLNLEFIEFWIKADSGEYGLQSIAQNAFEGCAVPQYVTAPMGIISKIMNCFSFVETINVIGYDDIPEYAFSGWIPQRTKAINIDEGVRKIGDMAFADCEITSFVLPASVTEVGVGILTYCPIESLSVASGNARYYAKNNYIIDSYSHSIVLACKNSGEILTSFKWVEVDKKTVKEYDVTSIANGAYKGVEIEKLTIPSNVKSIGDYAFEQSSLKAVVISSGVESIGRGAFEGATSLSSVTVADSVKSIGYAAFRGTEFYAQKQATEKGISYIGKVAYAYHGDKTEVVEFELADGTVGIAEHAFERMSNLKKIILPSSLKNIDKEAFVGCKNLTNLYFNGTDDEWKAVTKVRNWNLNLPKHKTWTLCRCEEKSHDHDGDGVVKAPDETADVCQNYKLLGAEVCEECFDKEVDKIINN